MEDTPLTTEDLKEMVNGRFRVPLPIVIVTVEKERIVDVRLTDEDFLVALLAMQSAYDRQNSLEEKEVKVER